MTDLAHNGFAGSANISFEDGCLHGKILFIDDVITYEGANPEELHAAFREAVDNYLAYCERTGKSPNKPYSGTFNVRIGRELHQKAATAAYKSGIKLNVYVAKAVQELVERNGVTKIEHVHNLLVTVRDELKPETRIATVTPPLSWEPVNATNH